MQAFLEIPVGKSVKISYTRYRKQEVYFNIYFKDDRYENFQELAHLEPSEGTAQFDSKELNGRHTPWYIGVDKAVIRFGDRDKAMPIGVETEEDRPNNKLHFIIKDGAAVNTSIDLTLL